MTKEEFLDDCAATLELTRAEMERIGFDARECSCGSPGCPGWVSQHKSEGREQIASCRQ